MSEKIFSKVQEILNYTFNDVHWLERALTHSSRNDGWNYQRLEFLGDRVLGLVIAEALFRQFKGENEGGLAKRHTALVQGKTLAVIGQAHNLGEYIIFSEAERQSGGQENENIISDVVESILGAVYIDGGYESVKRVVLDLYGDNIKTLKQAPQDPKTELQEWVQARGLKLPKYTIVDKSGPDHSPVFTIQLDIEGHNSLCAEGASRRQAEKTVARQMLKILKSENE